MYRKQNAFSVGGRQTRHKLHPPRLSSSSVSEGSLGAEFLNDLSLYYKHFTLVAHSPSPPTAELPLGRSQMMLCIETDSRGRLSLQTKKQHDQHRRGDSRIARKYVSQSPRFIGNLHWGRQKNKHFHRTGGKLPPLRIICFVSQTKRLLRWGKANTP